jgi:hypothetical protein
MNILESSDMFSVIKVISLELQCSIYLDRITGQCTPYVRTYISCMEM